MRIPRSYGRGLAVLGLLLPAAVALTAGTPAAARQSTSDLVWDRLADCESDGDWQADTGNGYYGGLQIWPPTWREAGGLRYADRPDHAGRRQQITVGEEILRLQGWQAWGGCAREIGML
ncbi:transglycosylase family protein [Kitasatospora sp. NPDC001540]|uniref:transglycosylase family protein n=1 Tax=Kitasatospora sp. NPDC001540 TaxID=3364014 RepID=UPI0036CDBF22